MYVRTYIGTGIEKEKEKEVDLLDSLLYSKSVLGMLGAVYVRTYNGTGIEKEKEVDWLDSLVYSKSVLQIRVTNMKYMLWV